MALDRKILITGASGRIGRLIASKGRAQGHLVVGVDRCRVGDIDGFNLACEPEKFASVLEAVRPDVIFHCAAVIESDSTLDQFCQNVSMAINVTEFVAALPKQVRPLVVNISSAAEIGTPSQLYCNETIHCTPVSAYGISKYCQTEAVLGQARRYGLRVVCARVFNLLPGNQPVMGWLEQIRKMKTGEQPLILRTGCLDPVRDFIEEEFAAELLIRVAFSDRSSGLVNIGTGKGTCLRDIVEIMRRASGVNFEVDETAFRSEFIPRVVADISLLTDLVGEVSHRDIESIICDLMAGAKDGALF